MYDPMNQTKEKWDSYDLSEPGFRIAWRCHGIL